MTRLQTNLGAAGAVLKSASKLGAMLGRLSRGLAALGGDAENPDGPAEPEAPPECARYEVWLGNFHAYVAADTLDEAIQNAREQFAERAPRLRDLIENTEAANFRVHELSRAANGRPDPKTPGDRQPLG